MAQLEIVVLSGVRSGMGTYGGSLKGNHATELGAAVVREAVKRATIKPEEVGHVVFGSAVPTDTRDIYLARVAAVDGGLPVKTPAFTLNPLGGSGLQAVVSAAQLIATGDASVTVAGGAEVMSSGPYWDSATRWGQRLGDTKLIDSVLGGLTDPFGNGHMGVTAENVAEKHDISREAQDELALQSNQRAAAAIKAGYFKEQILPIEYTVKGKTMVFDTDEHVKPNTTMEILAKLPPAFKANGTVTAGNASGMNDAAGAGGLVGGGGGTAQGVEAFGPLVGGALSGGGAEKNGVGPHPAREEGNEPTR